MGHERAVKRHVYPSPLPFWFKRKIHFSLVSLTTFEQVYMCSPYRQSCTHPAYGCQKDTPLAIDTPHLAVPRYIVKGVLDSAF